MSRFFEGLKPCYCDINTALYLADTFEALEKMLPEKIDMIFADPPYFLSNNGITCSGGRVVSVNKGDWDKIDGTEEKHKFNLNGQEVPHLLGGEMNCPSAARLTFFLTI